MLEDALEHFADRPKVLGPLRPVRFGPSGEKRATGRDDMAWYTNPASPTYGSTFHYIQVFNLDQDATVVGQVQVTLVNSQGNSQTVSAQ